MLTVLLFMVAKVVFMLCNRSPGTFTAADVKDVLLHGLSLDLSTALYFLIVPFLFVPIGGWVASCHDGFRELYVHWWL